MAQSEEEDVHCSEKRPLSKEIATNESLLSAHYSEDNTYITLSLKRKPYVLLSETCHN